MKKFVIGLICGIGLTATTAVYASDTIQAYLFPVKIMLNGESIEVDNNEYVVLNHIGHTYVPLRWVAENMGATVTYQESEGSTPPWIHLSYYQTDSGLLIKDPKENRVSIGNLQLKKIVHDYPNYVTAQLKLQDSPYPLSSVHFKLSFYDENGKLIEKGDGTGQLMKSGDIQTVIVNVGSLKNYSSVTLTVTEIIDISNAGHD
ncbi:hypothetical protein QFZ81_003696 [Paenibacillus sp. V4I9]|uniref:stalk domain-containing protein n=1 Tax=Paenibacillus sp. V4I9 TaxID=3042308 RepID=UPI00278500BC|nr:stalk domain-containing protein [Paenibacillus sp. V4I9]MDQ0888608.1 hypothetical protein [Paenibacillus sp. V4I9]